MRLLRQAGVAVADRVVAGATDVNDGADGDGAAGDGPDCKDDDPTRVKQPVATNQSRLGFCPETGIKQTHSLNQPLSKQSNNIKPPI